MPGQVGLWDPRGSPNRAKLSKILPVVGGKVGGPSECANGQKRPAFDSKHHPSRDEFAIRAMVDYK